MWQRIDKEKSWSRTWEEGHKHLGNLLIGTIVFTQIQLLVMIIHDHNNAINTVYRNSSYPIIMIICFDNEIMLFRLFSLSKVIYLKIMSFNFVKFVKWNYFDGVEGGGKKVKYDGVRWEGVVSNSQNKKNIYNYHCFF